VRRVTIALGVLAMCTAVWLVLTAATAAASARIATHRYPSTTQQAAPSGASSLWGAADTDRHGLGAEAGTLWTPVATPAGVNASQGASRPRACLVVDVPEDNPGITPGLAGLVEPAAELVEANSYYQECWYVDSGTIFFAQEFTYTPGEQGPNAYALAQVARSRTPLGLPEPQMAPAVDADHLVGLATWLWVDPTYWQPVTAHAEVPGVAVTVTAAPLRLTWEMGDGETVVCDGPGTPWDFDGPNPDSSDCSHTFRYVSAGQDGGGYRGSVTMEWDVTWQATTGEGGSLGVERRSSPFELTVTERQAVVCAGSLEACTTS
jgi:hypothetical protein